MMMMKLLLAVIAIGSATVVANDSEALKRFVVGNRAFSRDVYKQVAQTEKGNFLVCPQSAQIVLGLIRLAAKGPTAKQLSRSLGLPESNEEIVRTFEEVASTLRSTDKYTLSSANKIYVRHDYRIKEQFKRTAVDVFDGEVENVDFKQKRRAARAMNEWVEDKTHGTIKNLIDPDKIDDDARVVLINTMYFKGNWIVPFGIDATTTKAFYLDSANAAMTDTMHTKGNFKYYECDELKAKFLEMPYEGFDVTMTIVLPNEIEGLPAIESRIGDIFDAPKYTREEVVVEIPKFKEDTEVDFKKLLENLGVKDLFDDSADLSEMGEPGQPLLKVDAVVQKTFVDFNEKGTTAGAATAVMAVPVESVQLNRPKQFVADHPFVYYISSPSGVMFVGRFVEN